MSASVVCDAVRMAGSGKKQQDFENRSTTTMIAILPLEGDGSLTKSTVMCDQGLTDTGRECSLPAVSCLGVVETAHSAHGLTYLYKSAAMVGH